MNTKLDALIDLLDDPDLTVFEMVQEELLKETDEIIPALEQKWESSFDGSCQERIENIIQNLQFKETKRLLIEWLETDEKYRTEKKDPGEDFMQSIRKNTASLNWESIPVKL